LGRARKQAGAVESASHPLNGDAGFFTTVSPNGNQNASIWAVDRPAH
jgi:hypothetical protein